MPDIFLTEEQWLGRNIYQNWYTSINTGILTATDIPDIMNTGGGLVMVSSCPKVSFSIFTGLGGVTLLDLFEVGKA